MTDRTYSRPTKTVSRTQVQRRADKKLKKQINQGITPVAAEAPPPAVARRAGLRGKTYNYSDHVPKPVDPNVSSSASGAPVTAAVAIPVPYLADQQDIPASDSPEPEVRTQAPPPLVGGQSQENSHAVPVHGDNDDNHSQADTVIDDSQSSTSESECDANEGLETESGEVCDNRIEDDMMGAGG